MTEEQAKENLNFKRVKEVVFGNGGLHEVAENIGKSYSYFSNVMRKEDLPLNVVAIIAMSYGYPLSYF